MSKTNSWKAFGSKYLKAENVENNTDEYVITKVISENEDDKETIILTVERNEISKLFGCNVTNEQAVKAVCKDCPDQVVGKIVTFNKVQVKNPATQLMVDGLRIQFKKEEVKEPSQVDTKEAGINEQGEI